MNESEGRAKTERLHDRLFVLLAVLSLLAFLGGDCFYVFTLPAFAPSEATRQALSPFFTPTSSPLVFSLALFGELRFLLLLMIGGRKALSPLLIAAVPICRAFAVGFASACLLTDGAERLPFLLFTVFFALTLVIEAHAASLACLHSLLRNGQNEGLAAFVWKHLTPVGLTLLLFAAKDGLVRLL